MRLLQIALFLAFISHSSTGQGIDFSVTNFTQALAKAQAEDKLIFVDAYTTWCGPCKWMAKNVFTDADVGKYYNDEFVNVKIDMEKGDGPDLAKKWEIMGYPTLIYIDANGEVMHRSMGSRPAEDFVDLGRAANDPERQVTTMTKRFDAGERSSDFLKKYTDAMTSAGLKGFDAVATMYMDTQEDWSTLENMQFIFDYADASLESPLFKYSIEHRDAFVALVGQEKFEQKLSYAADKDRSRVGIPRDDLPALKLHFAKYYGKSEADLMAQKTYYSALMYSKDPVDHEKFIAGIQLFLATEPDLGGAYYNSVAWEVYEMTEDKAVLRKASHWADISLAEEKTSYNTDTKAAIEYKLGNMDAARRFALESIELAKEAGDDFSATEELLQKIGM